MDPPHPISRDVDPKPREVVRIRLEREYGSFLTNEPTGNQTEKSYVSADIKEDIASTKPYRDQTLDVRFVVPTYKGQVVAWIDEER
jgi:hypothetical protein